MTTNNTKIRFGVIGTNFVSDWVIAASREEQRFELIAVCSRTQDTADAYAAKHSIPHTFTSLEAMLQSELVDAVYIASPNSLHYSQSMLCMHYGKHVLCEKPFASNLMEAKAMIAAAKEHNVTLMEAMKPTLTPNFGVVRDQLHRVGEVRHYFSSFCQYSSRYDRFKTGDSMYAFNPELSNGAMLDIGIYALYPMVVLFGRPLTIKAQGIVLSSGVDGFGTVNFEYGSMTATVIFSKISDSTLPTEIQGEKGSILLDKIHTIKEVMYQPRQSALPAGSLPPMRENMAIETAHHEYYYELKEFIDLVLAGKRESTVNSHENTLICMEIMDEVRRQLGVVYPSDAIDILS